MEVFACEEEHRMFDNEAEASERTILEHDNNYRCLLIMFHPSNTLLPTLPRCVMWVRSQVAGGRGIYGVDSMHK